MKEIIKTEDPNIVIERSYTDKEIHLQELEDERDILNDQIIELEEKRASLEMIDIPVIARDLIDNEIANITIEIEVIQKRLLEIDKLL